MVGKLLNTKIARYLVAGGTAFIAEYLTFLSLYYLINFNLVYSNVLSFIAGLVTSFTINKLWVFNSSSIHETKKQLVLYISLALLNLALSTVGIRILVEHGLPAGIAKILFIVLIANDVHNVQFSIFLQG